MRGTIRGLVTESKDRVLASDPGLGRLRMALSGAVAMGTCLGVEFLFASATQAGAQGTLIAMLLGAIVAMMGSMALSGTGTWSKVRTAVFFPVAIGIGLLAGMSVAGNTDLMLAIFVVVMFVAVFVRRFGVPFFFYGFMTWMGYFFASFLHAPISMLPSLIAAVAVASAWVLLLSLTVLRQSPRRTLARILRAYDARTRALARACVELLDASTDEPLKRARWQRRMQARQAGLSEAALMVEGWSEERGALPAEWSGPALRRRLIDVQQILDRLASAASTLAGTDPELVAAAAAVLGRVAQRNDDAARSAAGRLAELAERAEAAGTEGWWSARHLAVAALEFLALASRATEPPSVEPVDEFSPTSVLAIGNLPGSPALFRDVPARGRSWNPLARLDMTSRQAIQVAIAGGLAIVVGRELSATRYYWAVIAAFVVFTGTATRSETLVKAVNRVVGTMLGLVAAIAVANLTAGSTTWVIVVILASVFCGFYLVRISYAYLIFFITIMIAQLYSVLHEFSDALLVLRLEETAIGAAAGIGVAVIFAPLSTRDTVTVARNNLLSALGDLLQAAATGLESPGSGLDLDALSRALDDRARQLGLVARPMTRPLLGGNTSPSTRHRLSLYFATVVHARALTVGLRQRTPADTAAAATACRALADAAGQLATIGPKSRPAPTVGEPLAAADNALFSSAAATMTVTQADDPVLRPLVHIHDVLAELADLRAGS